MIVKIPGSSANLGPGFDCFGLAWQLYNKIEFTLGGDRLAISGCPERFQNRDNLAFAGYKAVLNACGLSEEPVSIRFLETEIPVSRGLGSSAALIVGGAAAANALHGLNLTKEELLSVSTPVEGHPDNIAPSLFGGFTASSMDNGRAVTAAFPVSGRLHFTALVPDFELSTELSRSVLPLEYAKADAVFNVSRAALLIKALEQGDGALLAAALQDKIHQPYRSRLIPGYERAQDLAKNLGAAGMCISGAGSTLLCISLSPDFSAAMAEAMRTEFPAWRVLEMRPDTEGVQVINSHGQPEKA